MDDEPSVGAAEGSAAESDDPAPTADDDTAPDVDPHTQRAAVRDGYDGMAEDYRRERDEPEAPLVESFLADLSAGDRLLDAGCGQGTPVLNRVAGDVDSIGVDLSTSMLNLADDRTDTALVRGDLTRLPVASNAVDAVTALHSVIHVPVSEHPTVFQEFARVVRPGGRLYLTAAADEDGWSGANEDWLGAGELMAWSFPGLDRTREQLREAGFRVTDERVLDDTVADDDAGAWTHLFARLAGE
ncbi:methyltransferase domain-containing protein [Halobaculum sp. WSA2]|uniref:Methyltransferase domain-containing protein n=1 Tax=Halobaculum saliterrae TaxID=2073113 RepID=A0A6B0T044_9EURY|nr:class I SAM-dependent methyltransferase [Halobaculum saliterrae]MXR41972.1 methyltransferase domain-containing protein [Halobaculum saliterrae]